MEGYNRRACARVPLSRRPSASTMRHASCALSYPVVGIAGGDLALTIERTLSGACRISIRGARAPEHRHVNSP